VFSPVWTQAVIAVTKRASAHVNELKLMKIALRRVQMRAMWITRGSFLSTCPPIEDR